jgi:hypothetical protein
MPVPAPIQPRLSNDAASKGSALPEEKDLLDPDEVADVSYGSDKKPDTKAGGRTGASSLAIGLNTAGNSNQGLNV